MDRLTEKDEYGVGTVCENCPKRGVCNDSSDCEEALAEKLFSYEDTGLTPERCAELAQADREGRVVVLPCKVGDKCWWICGGKIITGEVSEIRVDAIGVNVRAYGRCGTNYYYHDQGDVYHTRSAAEAALGKEQEN